MNLFLFVSVFLVSRVVATSEGIKNRLDSNDKSLTQELNVRNNYEVAYDTCFSCCQGTETDCAESCGCSNLPPTQDSYPQDFASVSVDPERAHPASDWQHCKPTMLNLLVCPYPCTKKDECPCWDYCEEKACYLVAWEYPSKYSCVSFIIPFANSQGQRS